MNKILNKTKDTVISSKVKICKSIFSKALGLMFSFEPKPLIFIFNRERIVSLHMFFVFFPIDVLFLDEEMSVVEVKKNLRPWKFYIPKKMSKFVIELPMGTIDNSNTEIGDYINFQHY